MFSIQPKNLFQVPGSLTSFILKLLLLLLLLLLILLLLLLLLLPQHRHLLLLLPFSNHRPQQLILSQKIM
jgi:hypothetical protein